MVTVAHLDDARRSSSINSARIPAPDGGTTGGGYAWRTPASLLKALNLLTLSAEPQIEALGAVRRSHISGVRSKYGLKLGPNVRYMNTNRFVHCHNKLIVIDGDQVLVSSQNWSDSAVSKIREAGLLLSHKGIARYFTPIFESDWSTVFSKLPKFGPPRVELATLRNGGYVSVDPADYRDV